MSDNVSRRTILQQAAGLAAAAAGSLAAAGDSKRSDKDRYRPAPVKPPAAPVKPAHPFGYAPFTQKCPIPRVLAPKGIGREPWKVGAVHHGVAPEYNDRRCADAPDVKWHECYPTQFFELRCKVSLHEYLPGVKTPVYGYGGMIPGPTIRTVVGQPCVIRVWNDLDLETACHFHGSHLPSHSAGAPNQYVLPGRARDYFLPCTVPMQDGRPDYSESPSTMWYHDRAMAVAGANNYYGLSGFCLSMDDLEYDLVKRNVLPPAKYDIPLCLQDRCLNPDGSLCYLPGHSSGNLGNLYAVNGKVQPVLAVERRKYRFRLLNSCNTRYLRLKLHNNMKLICLGKDSWLYDKAVEEDHVVLCPGERADIVIDFTDCEKEVFLCNFIHQTDGCNPHGKPRSGDEYGKGGGDKDDDRESGHDKDRGYGGRDHDDDDDDRKYSSYGHAASGCVPWLKFVVEGPKQRDCATVKPGDYLRPHRRLNPAACETTRYFDIESAGSGYQINRRPYEPSTCHETPKIGTLERWVYRNKTADACPIHLPGGSCQISRINGKAPYRTQAQKCDTVTVYGGEEVEILKHFNTFAGTYTAHCSSVEYDYRRGMLNYRTLPKPGKY
jgi:FtsP/CotA-like multicopper oxidase with cupredoxin domain